MADDRHQPQEPDAGKAGAFLCDGAQDRAFLVDLLDRMATPVVSRLAQGRLQQQWTPERSPDWGDRNPKLAYFEAFARLTDGIAPWLELPTDGSHEGRLRARLLDQVLASIDHGTDPGSPDYFAWRGEGQTLVEAAFLASALLRAPQTLWSPLSQATKARIVAEVSGLRHILPSYNNWLLFPAMNEIFLRAVGAQWDPMRVALALRKFDEWYVGDGWYGDGAQFRFDGYNGFVIHPMLMQILNILDQSDANFGTLDIAAMRARQLLRMQAHAATLERMIGPDGAFPPVGRSVTYRTAVHQPLAFLAWRKALGDRLPEGQVRAATLAAQRRIFADPGNFDADGFLTIGFARHQPSLAEGYSNGGSMYIAAESLLALGLPADDSYWTAPPQPWTMQSAYGGADFSQDRFFGG